MRRNKRVLFEGIPPLRLPHQLKDWWVKLGKGGNLEQRQTEEGGWSLGFGSWIGHGLGWILSAKPTHRNGVQLESGSYFKSFKSKSFFSSSTTCLAVFLSKGTSDIDARARTRDSLEKSLQPPKPFPWVEQLKSWIATSNTSCRKMKASPNCRRSETLPWANAKL